MSENRDPFAEAREDGLLIRRRRLTEEECRKHGYPVGTEAPCDEHGNLPHQIADDDGSAEAADDFAHHAQAELAQAQVQQACSTAGMTAYPYGGLTGCYPTPEASMRLNCLQMALMVADGAAPPPLKDVIERARAYWRFVQCGE